MKREITCQRDGEAMILGNFPGEGWRKVFGPLKGTALCDICNRRIYDGEQACAVSMFRAGEYFSWERQFLDDRSAWKVQDIGRPRPS